MSGYIIDGSHGDDELSGSWGDDDIYGADGDDDLYGDHGDDILDGAEGDDYLNGGDGDDLLWAGFGQDELVGGRGSDAFGFYAPGDFIINDFNVFSDMLLFDSETTGIYNVDNLIDAVSDIEDSEIGVVIDFGHTATITLVGVCQDDLDLVWVGFV